MPLLFRCSHLPRAVQTVFIDKVLQPEFKAIYPYRARHAPLDAGLMFELLVKGFGLSDDPEPVCKALRADYSAQGKALTVKSLRRMSSYCKEFAS